MEFVEIYPPYLYTVRYEEGKVDAYSDAFRTLTCLPYLQEYFRLFNDKIDDEGEKIYGFRRNKTLLYANKAHKDAQNLRTDVEKRCKELIDGVSSDFGNCFKPHSNYDIRSSREGGGKSITYKVGYLPVKSKGGVNNSLVRLYAIELSLDCYIIIYGGIKITKRTQDTPALDDEGRLSTLEAEIQKKIYTVCSALSCEKIVDSDGINQVIEA